MFRRLNLWLIASAFLLITACGGEDREERWTREGRAKKNAAIEKAREEARKAKEELARLKAEAEKAASEIQKAKEPSSAEEIAESSDAVPDAASPKTKVIPGDSEVADISGKWELNFEVPGAPQKRTILIKQEGSTASAIMDGKEVPIRINGQAITFDMPQETPLGKMTINYKGNVQGDDILGIFKMPRGPLSGQNLSWSGKRQ